MKSIPKIPEVSMTITGEMSVAGADQAAQITAMAYGAGFFVLMLLLGVAAVIWAARRSPKNKDKEAD